VKNGVVEAKITLRAKSQLTLPQRIVRKLNLKPGDRLLVRVQEDNPEVIQIRPLHRSYAGVAAGTYGTPDEVRAYIRGERSAWDE